MIVFHTSTRNKKVKEDASLTFSNITNKFIF